MECEKRKSPQIYSSKERVIKNFKTIFKKGSRGVLRSSSHRKVEVVIYLDLEQKESEKSPWAYTKEFL